MSEKRRPAGSLNRGEGFIFIFKRKKQFIINFSKITELKCSCNIFNELINWLTVFLKKNNEYMF